MTSSPDSTAVAQKNTLATHRTIITAFMAFTAVALSVATFEYMMVPLQIDLAISVDGLTGLTLTPVAASLLVVFVVGALGDRLGLRRTMSGGAILYVLGAVLVMVATSQAWVMAGRGLTGIGGITLAITGLATLNATCRDAKERGKVFGYLAAILPATFLLGALVAAGLTDSWGWRTVPVLWILLGVAILVSIRLSPFTPVSGRAKGELATPILAGLVLAGLGIAATTLTSNRAFAVAAVTVAVTALVALLLLMRALSHPTLDLRVLRPRGATFIVGAILLTTAVNFYFFVNLFIQYRFQLPLIQVSLLFVAPQIAGVAGGIIGGRISSRWNAPTAATIALGASAAGALCFLFVRAESPVWVPIVVLTLMSLPNSASVGPLTQLLLDGAPAEGSGAASAVRSALWSVGGIFGSIALGSIAFTAFTASLTDSLHASGLDLSAASALAEKIRSGGIVAEIQQELSATAPLSGLELSGLTSGLGLAQLHALHLLAIIGFAMLVCAGILLGVLAARARKDRVAHELQTLNNSV